MNTSKILLNINEHFDIYLIKDEMSYKPCKPSKSNLLNIIIQLNKYMTF